MKDGVEKSQRGNRKQRIEAKKGRKKKKPHVKMNLHNSCSAPFINSSFIGTGPLDCNNATCVCVCVCDRDSACCTEFCLSWHVCYSCAFSVDVRFTVPVYSVSKHTDAHVLYMCACGCVYVCVCVCSTRSVAVRLHLALLFTLTLPHRTLQGH